MDRTIPAVLAIGLATALPSCEGEARQERERLLAELRSSSAAKAVAEAQMTTAQRQLSELRKRANAIYTIQLIASISGVTNAGDGSQRGRLVTFLSAGELVSRGGTVFRFIGRSTPPASPDASLSFVYRPIDASQLLAQQLDVLAAVESVRLDLAAGLRAAGFAWDERSSLHLQLEVNGLPVVTLERAIDTAQAERGWTLSWPIGAECQAIPENYTRLLAEKGQ